MNDAGYDARIGYDVPDFAKAQKDGKIVCELWLSDGEYSTWENTQTAIHAEDTVECYVYRFRQNADAQGQWYSDIDDAFDALTDNAEGRTYEASIWWDDSIIPIDRASPLKRWNNASSYSAGWLCARIDLPVKYQRTI
jgi:hypothetical protein